METILRGKTFVNFTNHKSDMWNEKQIEAAEQHGTIIDLAFPNVDPECTEEEIRKLGARYCNEIIAYDPKAVLCQGEFTLAFNVINRLKEKGIKVMAACSERKVIETGDRKTSIFRFVQFREYI